MIDGNKESVYFNSKIEIQHNIDREYHVQYESDLIMNRLQWDDNDVIFVLDQHI